MKFVSFFKHIDEAPSIEMFDISKKFMDDQSDKKVNLSVGGEFC